MIPNHDDIMLPLLSTLADKQAYTLQQLIKILAQHFNLDTIEQKECLPGKQEALFNNRTGWARSYLTQARLVESTGRRRCRITPRGMDVLQLKPEAINTDFLKQFPDFQEITKKSRKNRASLSGLRRGIISHGSPQGTPLQSFQSREKPFVGEGFMPSRLNHPETKNHNPIFTSLNENPYEAIESLYQTLRQSLAADLLEKIKRVSPAFFEQLVVDVLVAMGYGGSQKDAAQTLGRSGDGGVDGIIKEDKLGLDVIYIQAKRWENPVGRPEIQGFAGSLEGFRAKKGVFMTTSRFTKEAREYVERIASRIILIEGQQLAELMIDFNVGTSEYQRYIVKKLDADYFEEE